MGYFPGFLGDLQNWISSGFEIKGMRIFDSSPSFRVAPLYSPEDSFNRVLEKFQDSGLYPVYRENQGQQYIYVTQKKERKRKLKPVHHWLLLLATAFTVTSAGYLWWAPGDLLQSIFFAVALMTILGGHELGHYLMAKKNSVEATLPFFIPVPPFIFPFGTMGAVIMMGSPIPSRKVLMEIGIAGPIVGFLLTIPVLIFGLANSQIVPAKTEIEPGEIIFFMQPLMAVLTQLIHGSVPQGFSLDPHPLAMAGWIGLFVTFLNLMPIGQLDGGHIARALMPNHYERFFRVVFGILLLMGMITFPLFPGWIMWALVVFLLTKLKHPGPLNDVTELDWKHKLMGVALIIMLIATFAPIPLTSAEAFETVSQVIDEYSRI